MEFIVGLVGAFIGATASIVATFLGARAERQQELRVHHRTEFLNLASGVFEAAQRLVGALGDPQNKQGISATWNGMVPPLRRMRLYAPASMLDPLARFRAAHEDIGGVLRGQLAPATASGALDRFARSLEEFEDAMNRWADTNIRTVAG